MCEKQEDFIHILEDIADMEMKINIKGKKSTMQSVNLVEPVEKMKERFQNLDKDEREKLLEGSRLMYEDSAGTSNLNSAITTLIVSVLAAIISAVSLVISAANNDCVDVAYLAIASTILIVLVVFMAIKAFYIIKMRSKVADNYRNACLTLIALSDDNKEEKAAK